MARRVRQRHRQQHTLLVTDATGDIRDGRLGALGRSGRDVVEVPGWIPLPPGSQLLSMPDCMALGTAPAGVRADDGWPVAAMLPHGYTRTHLPAYQKLPGAPLLPLFGYTAVCVAGDQVLVAAVHTDDAPEWQFDRFATPELPERVAGMRQASPANATLTQLAKCAQEYGCYTAQNVFYDRWEAALPTSNACNARCVGCISEQEVDGPPTPQQRIKDMALRRDIVALAVQHLEGAAPRMVSYGQGCEGEPLLNWRLLVECTRTIRQRTSRGWINVNTNGCNPDALRSLIDAGLDACRVSVFSARQDTFAAYYRPRNYTFAEVEQSLAIASEAGLFTSINLLVFPGVTDQALEVEALIAMLRRTCTRMVQLRNLTIDPEQLLDALPAPDSPAIGITTLIEVLRQELPDLVIGNSTRLPGQTPLMNRAAAV